MKPKIAFVARNLPPLYGGGGMLARTLAIGFVKRGYEVDILTDTPAPDPVEKCKVYSPYKTIPSVNSLNRLRLRFCEYWWLRNRIKKGEYNIVYGVSAQPFTLSAAHVAKRLGIPASFETSLFGNDDYLTICHQRLGIIWKHLFLSADKIVNISPPLEKACLDGGIPQYKLELIPNPVNEQEFYPASFDERKTLRSKFHLEQGAKVFFSAGAICHRKGSDRLISALIEIVPKEPSAILVLAGPVDNHPETLKFTNGLRSKIEKAGFSDRVRWLGRVDNVGDWMRASDIFMFASRREGFGTVFTEAMAVGIPIVAYSIEGITDFIFREGSGAFIVNSEEAYFNALLSLARSKALRHECGESLRLQYSKTFSSKIIMDTYQRLFQKSLKRNLRITMELIIVT